MIITIKYGGIYMKAISTEHQKYLAKQKKEKIQIICTQIAIVIAFIALWYILVKTKTINEFIFSSPQNVMRVITDLIQTGNFWNHIYITCVETLVSFSLAIILGLIIATLLWYNRFLAKVMDPYLTILNSLPKVSLGPLIIIWVGANTNSIIVMALMISLIVTIITIYEGFIHTPEEYLTVLKSFKATRWKQFYYGILPANKETILQSMRVNIGMCLIGVIMGELLVSKEGIGYLIMYGSQVFNLDLVIAGVVLLAILSVIMYYIVVIFGKWMNQKNK